MLIVGNRTETSRSFGNRRSSALNLEEVRYRMGSCANEVINREVTSSEISWCVTDEV